MVPLGMKGSGFGRIGTMGSSILNFQLMVCALQLEAVKKAFQRDGNLVGCVTFHICDGSHGRSSGCSIRIYTSLPCQHYHGAVDCIDRVLFDDVSWVGYREWNAYATDVVGAENLLLVREGAEDCSIAICTSTGG